MRGAYIGRTRSEVASIDRAPPLPPFLFDITMSRPSTSPRTSEADIPNKPEDGHVNASQHSPEFEAEVAAAAPRLSGAALTAAIAFVAGTGFTLFGCVRGLFVRKVATGRVTPISGQL